MVFKVISCNGVINSIPSAEVFCLASVFYIESVLIANVPVITYLFLSLNVPFITAIIESRQALFKGFISSLIQVTKAFLLFPWCFTLPGPDTRSLENILLLVMLLNVLLRCSEGQIITVELGIITITITDFLKTIFSILVNKALFFSFMSGKRKQN